MSNTDIKLLPFVMPELSEKEKQSARADESVALLAERLKADFYNPTGVTNALIHALYELKMFTNEEAHNRRM